MRKGLLREFGKSSASLAFPSADWIVVATFTVQTINYAYTAPADGFFSLGGSGQSGTTSCEVFCAGIQSLSTNPGFEWGRVWVPVRKGQLLSLNIFSAGACSFSASFSPARISSA